MASVREVQRKNGRAYEVRWELAGRDRQRTFQTRREAERFSLKIENELAEGNSTEPLVQRGKTVEQVVEASLLASKPKLKASTHAGYTHLYQMRVLPRFGKQRIAAVTSEQVEAWLGEMVAAGRASSTVHNHFVALNKVFRYALRHRLINPARPFSSLGLGTRPTSPRCSSPRNKSKPSPQRPTASVRSGR